MRRKSFCAAIEESWKTFFDGGGREVLKALSIHKREAITTLRFVIANILTRM